MNIEENKKIGKVVAPLPPLPFTGSYLVMLTFTFVAVPVVHIASAIGGWLFFVQHQFDEAHWHRPPDWDQQVAALFGSSYYKLPAVLNWFTGNIGMHHIHHLNSMIPNYRLTSCLRNSPDLQGLNQLTLWITKKEPF